MSAAYKAWIYDQLEPEEKCARGGGIGFIKPRLFDSIPEHLLYKGDERTEEEKEKAEDEFLKRHGI